jgi:hypothetical protein
LSADSPHLIDDQLSPTARNARLAYRATAWLFSACVLFQVFLVGMDLFGATHDPSLHRNFAYIYGWLIPVMLVLARVGRLSAAIMGLTFLLLALFAVQTVLPGFTKQFPILGPLHVINAFAMFGLSIFLGMRVGRTDEPHDTEGDR